MFLGVFSYTLSIVVVVIFSEVGYFGELDINLKNFEIGYFSKLLERALNWPPPLIGKVGRPIMQTLDFQNFFVEKPWCRS